MSRCDCACVLEDGVVKELCGAHAQYQRDNTVVLHVHRSMLHDARQNAFVEGYKTAYVEAIGLEATARSAWVDWEEELEKHRQLIQRFQELNASHPSGFME